MLERAITLALRVRWSGLAVIVALAALACAGLSRLTITADSRVFIGPDNPYRVTFDQFEKTFSSSENVFVAVWADAGDVFTPQRLAALHALTEKVWSVPYVLRVDSLTNFAHSHADGETIVIEALVTDPAALTAAKAAEIREIALTDDLVRGNFVTRDGSMAGINLSINPGFPPAAPHQILAALDRTLAEFTAAHPDLKVGVTGSIAMARAFYDATWSDLRILVPISFACMFGFMTLMLRSLSLSLVVLTQVVLCAAVAMGLAGWFGIVLNPASVNAGIIVAVLVIAHNIYLVTAVQTEQQTAPSQADAVGRALRHNIFAVFLSGLTTALGCLSFNACDAPPFRDLGNITAAGLVCGFLFWCTLMPAMLTALPLPARPPVPIFPQIEPFMAEFVIRNRRRLLVIGTVIAIALSVGVVNLRLVNDFLKDFDERFAFRRITELVNDRFGTRSVYEFVLDSRAPNGAIDPAFLAKVDTFTDWLRQQPDVASVYTLTDIIKRINRDLNGGDPQHYVLPATREATAQTLLLYELSLPAGLDLTDRMDIDKQTIRVSVRGSGGDSIAVVDFENRARQWALDNPAQAVAFEITGLSVIYGHIAQVNTKSMINGNFFAFVTVSLIMIIVLRRPRVITLGLLSNVTPSLVALGVWGLLDGRVGMSVAVVVAMTFGIVVDDTIHSILAYLDARERLPTREDAIRHVFATVGRPIVVTTIILSLGFGVLVFSGHAVTANFGFLSALVIGIAVFFDYFLLPSALLLFDRLPRERRDAAG